MNILIIEDEVAAAKQIQKMICDMGPTYKIISITESVKETLLWLENNPKPDLIISDIELADGISFEIFKQVKIATPIIFTTAYNTYMQNAFKVNSIDYLLKPIDKEELQLAFIKYQSLTMYHYDPAFNDKLEALLQSTSIHRVNYKTRFLVKTGDRLSTVPIEDVAFLRADDRIVFLHTVKGQKYIIDGSLDDLEKIIDPNIFFRLNRRYISQVNFIEKIHTYFNGKLKINLRGSDDAGILVSKEKSTAFKKWLDK